MPRVARFRGASSRLSACSKRTLADLRLPLRLQSLAGLAPCALELRPTDGLVREVPIIERLLRYDAVPRFVGLHRRDAACVSCVHYLINRRSGPDAMILPHQLDRARDPTVLADVPQEGDVILLPAGAELGRHARIVPLAN